MNSPVGQLVLRVLGCRLDATLPDLVGVMVCEASAALKKLVEAYFSAHDLMVELNLIKFSHYTKFTSDR